MPPQLVQSRQATPVPRHAAAREADPGSHGTTSTARVTRPPPLDDEPGRESLRLRRAAGGRARLKRPGFAFWKRLWALNTRCWPSHCGTWRPRHLERGEGDAALENLRRALDVTEHSLGPDHPDTAKVLKAIGREYASAAQYAAAIPYFERALKICETALGPDDAEVAILASDLAVAYRDSANYKAARPLFARSVAVAEKAYGDRQPGICQGNR